MTPQEQLRAACAVQEGWDGEPGSALPDTRAKLNATAALALFEAAGLPPEDVDADALGGIALEWNGGLRGATLRCRNTGRCVLTLHGAYDFTFASRYVDPTSFAEIIPEVRTWLGGVNSPREVKP